MIEITIGYKSNLLTVIANAEPDKYKAKRVLCKCDCGTEIIRKATDLRTGKAKSCGCKKGWQRDMKNRGRRGGRYVESANVGIGGVYELKVYEGIAQPPQVFKDGDREIKTGYNWIKGYNYRVNE